MQAITESNEHVETVQNLLSEINNVDTAFLEAQLAETKATQAVAYALLTVAEALNRAFGDEARMKRIFK